MKLRMLVVMVAVVLAVLMPLSAGQFAATVPLPADLQGELEGVPYHIRVPANWNGTLLVYSYGYADALDPLPLAPKTAEEDTLLARGFALAAVRAAGAVPIAGLTPLTGWNFKERIQNTAALTAAFRGMVGQPRRTIVWGRSMGGLVTLALIEKHPGLYDGGVALCPPAAGTPSMFDQRIDITLAYAVAFGWNPAWGTPGKLRSDLNFMAEVYPHAVQQLTPGKFGRWEFLRLVSRAPNDSYYVFPGGTPGRLQSVFMAFATQVELNNRAGGTVAQNIGRVYTLTDEEKAYLAGLGVDADDLLAKMNEQTTFASDRNARNYVEHYFNPTGGITRPVLTLHTTGDPLAIPNNEDAYRIAVERQGGSHLLMQQFTRGVGHCTFTSGQDIAAIDAMMSWLDTGTRPDSSTFFPEALGFNPSFVPEPWPW